MNEPEDAAPGPPQADLRREAERRLRKKKATPVKGMAEVDVRALLHELQVHQIELEMQNEELHHAQVAAEEASQKYGDLFDFAPVGYFVWNHEGLIREVNLAGAALLGLDRGKAVKKRFGQFLAAKDRVEFAEFCRRVTTADTKHTCEFKILRDGQAIDVLVEGIAAGDRPWQERLCRAAVIDISQQKRADELAAANQTLQAEIAARKRAEEEIRSLAEFPKENPNPIIRATGDGFMSYANQPAVRLLEAMGWQAGQPLPDELLRPARRVLESGERIEFDLLCRQGRTFSFSVAPSSRAGQVNLYARDITARKQAEIALQTTLQRFYVVLSGMYTGVLLVTDEGRVEFANQAFCDSFGLGDTAADLTGLAAGDIIEKVKRAYLHPDEAVARIREILERGQPVMGEEVAMRDGRTCLRDFVPLNVEGKSYGRLWLHFDITGRKRAEEEVRLAKEAAEAANAAKSRFLANMSHELRTPMNAILGMIDVALPRALDPTVQDCLQTAKGSAGLLLTLLNDLLDSAKIESGKLELEAAPFSLRRMLDQVARGLGLRADEKGLAFSCRTPADVPDALIGDQVRLRQVLSNLADNAVKFTERGEVEVSVRLRSRKTGVANLEFIVRDTGIGIPHAELERIFHPFAQADASTTRRFGGTGLGLSICASLVGAMGGRIWAESGTEKGSTFRFTVRLPLAAELPPEAESPPPLPAAPLSKLRILLVEDNPANQKLAAYVLQDRGHTVEVAGNGRQAISLAQQNRYDLILMDVQMPGMDGLETTAAIRAAERGEGTPIIAMTAHAMKGDQERFLAGGMDGYLAKPIGATEMIAMVERLAAAGSACQVGPCQVGPACRAGLPCTPHAPREEGPPGPARQAGPTGPAATVYDPAVALKHCLNKPDLLRQMIDFFFKDAETLLPQIRAALEKGNLAEAGRLGHRVKGTLVHLGAVPAGEAAKRVERFMLHPGQRAEAEEALRALERECEVLKQVLSAHRAAAPLAAEGD